MSVFLTIDSRYIADKIHSAQSKVIYVSPGLDEVVASALINTAKRIGLDNVTVIVDVSQKVCRFGYGIIDGITLLQENRIPIKEAPGIRIGALVYDSCGLIISPTPLLIEAGSEDQSAPNAMTVTSDQVKKIIDSVIPPDSTKSNQQPEIGATEASAAKIEKVHQALVENPPQKFDLARKVQVFSTQIEFVEIKLRGCEIQRHTVSLPTDLLVGKVDISTKRQLRAGFTIIEKGSRLSGDSIRNELNELKKMFTRPIPKYGNVLLKSKKKLFNEAVKNLEDSIEKFQKDVEKNLKDELKKARERLQKMLVPAMTKNPPVDLSAQIQGDNPTKEQVDRYLLLRIDDIFPSAEDITKAMSLDCIIKAVTYETISDEGFQDHIKRAYPLIDWDEMYEEYDAARESQ